MDKTLLEAADLIERTEWYGGPQRGWTRGILGTDAHCAYTAICVSTGRKSLRPFRSVNRLRRFLNVDSIPGWNDDNARTREEVLGALRAAALPRRKWKKAREKYILVA